MIVIIIINLLFNKTSSFIPRVAMLYDLPFQVPGYLDKVNKPMDFSTMRCKIERHAYQSLQEFEDDFDLVINNCLKFNAKQTIFHKAATRLRQQVIEYNRFHPISNTQKMKMSSYDSDQSMILL